MGQEQHPGSSTNSICCVPWQQHQNNEEYATHEAASVKLKDCKDAAAFDVVAVVGVATFATFAGSVASLVKI